VERPLGAAGEPRAPANRAVARRGPPAIRRRERHGAVARANDAVAADEPSSFEILRPIMRAFSSEPAKAYVPPPAAEASTAAVIPQHACGTRRTRECSSGAAHDRRAGAGERRPAAANRIARVTGADESRSAATGPSPREIENLVVALVMYYEAGDADRIVEMIDPESIGFFRKSRMRQAYGDFFRATQKRELRIERLAWSTSPGTATAKGEATVRAQYADRAPLDAARGPADGNRLARRTCATQEARALPDSP
jgi:hypothetical protein